LAAGIVRNLQFFIKYGRRATSASTLKYYCIKL